MSSLSAWTNEQFDPRLSWADVEWVKKRWGGKLILKGIQDVEDAKLAAGQRRRRAIVVSNHGGRQLDGARLQHRGAAGHRGGGGLADRGLDGRRHPLRPGRAQGLGAGRPRHHDRPRHGLRPGRHGRGRRQQGAADHPQRARHHHGLLRPYRHQQRWIAASCCRAPTRRPEGGAGPSPPAPRCGTAPRGTGHSVPAGSWSSSRGRRRAHTRPTAAPSHPAPSAGRPDAWRR